MKTVISASRRSDIPAFYLNWFKDAIRAGFVDVANPLYPQQSRKVDLSPDSVSWIVFWSRNYARFLKEPDFFSAYQLFFHFTILPQSKLEPRALPLPKALHQMEKLTALFGPERIIWRYDPLVFWQEAGTLHSNHNPQHFKELCHTMASFGITRCYTSLAHPYAKFIHRFKLTFPQNRLMHPEPSLQQRLLSEMAEIAAINGIELFSCSNDELLSIKGIKKGHCIDGNLLRRLVPETKISIARMPTRKDCGCTKSIDIGDYRTQPCGFGCLYCYANPKWEKTKVTHRP